MFDYDSVMSKIHVGKGKEVKAMEKAIYSGKKDKKLDKILEEKGLNYFGEYVCNGGIIGEIKKMLEIESKDNLAKEERCIVLVLTRLFMIKETLEGMLYFVNFAKDDLLEFFQKKKIDKYRLENFNTVFTQMNNLAKIHRIMDTELNNNGDTPEQYC